MITSALMSTSPPAAPPPRAKPAWTVETDKCEIDFDVPRLVDSTRAADADGINAAVARRFDAARTNFAPSPDSHSTLSGNGSVAFDDGHLTAVSLAFDEYSGGAHPNPWLETVLYDSDQHREVGLDELFKDRGAALDDLSRQLTDVLKAQPDMDEYLIASCATPSAENLAAYHPSAEGLTFALPAARVGPIGAGMYEATISWNDLRQTLDPNGALWRESAPFTWSLAGDEAKACFTRLVNVHRPAGMTSAADPKDDAGAPQAAHAFRVIAEALPTSGAGLSALTEQYARLREALAACGAGDETPKTFMFLESELRNGIFGDQTREQVTGRFLEGLGLTGTVDAARAYVMHPPDGGAGKVENGEDAVVIGGIRIPKKS